jgi:uncharacterized membrane protein YsdA (DUF1294 family)
MSAMRSKRDLTARAVIAAFVAGVVVAVALVAATGFSALAAYVAGIGLITFLTYGYDKLQAGRGGRRVTEPALLVLSVIGGALGGWAGMLIWRHKTRHARFWAAQVIGTLVIVAAFWLV